MLHRISLFIFVSIFAFTFVSQVHASQHQQPALQMGSVSLTVDDTGGRIGNRLI